MAEDTRDDDQVPVRSAALVAVILLLAVVGAVLWFTRAGDPVPASSAASTSTEASTAGEPMGAPTSPTSPSSDLGPSEVIPGWSSVEVAGITLPVSTEAGPHDLSGGRARDFEHTELGAVMAAVHLVYFSNGYAGPEVYEPTIAEQVVDGDNQQRLLAVAQAAYDQGVRNQGRDDPRGSAVLRGYRVTSYTDDAASVEVWSEGPASSGRVRIGTTVDLVWRDGRWMILPPPDGQWSERVRELTRATTEQFTEFPPEVR